MLAWFLMVLATFLYPLFMFCAVNIRGKYMRYSEKDYEDARKVVKALIAQKALPECDISIGPTPRQGAFKRPFIVYSPEGYYFLALDKPEYECDRQKSMRSVHPAPFSEMLCHGSVDGISYSLETFYDIKPVGELTEDTCPPKEAAYIIGRVVGEFFRITSANSSAEARGNVHFDPHNIHFTGSSIDNILFMLIDVGDIRKGNLHDLVGVFTTREVGESSLELTISNPNDFLMGVSASTGISMAELEKIRKEVPTDDQCAQYLSKLG